MMELPDMQEIAPNVFIEKNSLGLITGVIRTEEGTVLIDSPIRLDDSHPWRSGSAHASHSALRFLVLLDTNYDRLLSAKGMDYVIIAHANSLLPVKPKPASAKAQEDQSSTGETMENLNSPGRQILPEITFQQDLDIYLGPVELHLEHHTGVSNAGLWVELPKEKVLFIRDTVTDAQPPFIAYFDADVWLADLDLLSSQRYQGYQMVSSRSGIITSDQIAAMSTNIAFIRDALNPLMEANASLEEALALIPKIMARYNVEPMLQDLYYNRLRWGLTTYYESHHSSGRSTM
jgi:cyclase